jgi:hypothetical protein
MVFTIEEDEEIDYTIYDNKKTENTNIPDFSSAPPSPAPDMSIFPQAFPDDHFVPEEKSRLLGDRVIGTFGFCGALALLFSTCCCCCRGCHKAELTHTYNKHTIFGMCCPFKF